MRTKQALFVIGFLLCMRGTLIAQRWDKTVPSEVQVSVEQDYLRLRQGFETAYKRYPAIPRGVLEAVSFTYTRFAPCIWKDTLENDPDEIPRTYSAMGLTLHGKGYFKENLRRISRSSGIPLATILESDSASIIAYAKCLDSVCATLDSPLSLSALAPVMAMLSEIPDSCTFALNSLVYSIYCCLSDSSFGRFGIPYYEVDFQAIFQDQLQVLQRKYNRVESDRCGAAETKEAKSVDYPGALWVPAATCNYSGRNGVAVSGVAVHYTSGTYSGAIAWFQNCAAKTSAHYVVRSMDGQVTQMVREADKAWHVGVANGYTIGIEHEAYGNVAAYFTSAMYASSAALVRDICARHARINPLHVFYRDTLDDGTVLNNGLHSLGGSSACTQIRGHQHFPSQTHTDPGPCWNWNLYYKLINPVVSVDTATAHTGRFCDSGGPAGEYGNDERKLFLIHVQHADSVELDFTDFQLEPDYDFMWIYAGSTVYSPLLGRWNTQSPGRVVVAGGDLLVEFRSDCAGTRAGWDAHWTAHLSSGIDAPPVTQVLLSDTVWHARDFMARFQDSDDVAVRYRFFQLMENDDNVWSANARAGFFADNFDTTLSYMGWLHDGQWMVHEHTLRYVRQHTGPSWIVAPLNGQLHPAYLYDFYLSMDEDTGTCSFLFHADTSVNVAAAQYLGVSFCKGSNMLSVWKRDASGTCILHTVPNVSYPTDKCLYRIVWDFVGRKILVLRHSSMLAEVDVPGGIALRARYVGFMSSSLGVTVDDFSVYGGREDSVMVSVGASVDKMVRRQAKKGIPTCKIKSVVMDSAGQFSPVAEKMLRVDYTAPYPARGVVAQFKCQQQLQQTSQLSGILELSWGPARDDQSQIQQYYYTIDMEQHASTLKIVRKANGLSTSCCLKMVVPQGSILKVGVMAEDSAGLPSHAISTIVSAGF